jgi:hypothetical protein
VLQKKRTEKKGKGGELSVPKKRKRNREKVKEKSSL